MMLKVKFYKLRLKEKVTLFYIIYKRYTYHLLKESDLKNPK